MKKLNLLCVWMLAAVTLLPILQSCDDDDNNDLGTTIGTIRVTGERFYIQSDRGNTIYPVNNPAYQPVDGQRVTADFEIIEDDYNGYDYGVRFYRIYNILTKQVQELTEENEEEIGNDPVRLIRDNVWIGGGYLNVYFEYYVPVRQAHRVSLVRNTLVEPADDDYIHLEYRYNTYNDETNYSRIGLVSFNLNSLEDELKAGAKGIKLKFTSATTGAQELTFNIKTVDQQSNREVNLNNLEAEDKNLE